MMNINALFSITITLATSCSTLPTETSAPPSNDEAQPIEKQNGTLRIINSQGFGNFDYPVSRDQPQYDYPYGYGWAGGGGGGGGGFGGGGGGFGVVGNGGFSGGERGNQYCTYWCPDIRYPGEFVCCNEDSGYSQPYQCPELRRQCQAQYPYRHRPQYCNRNTRCPSGLVCCPDACVMAYVCKPPKRYQSWSFGKRK